MSGWRLGIALAVLQQIGFTVETSAIHAFGGSLTAPQMALLRCLGGVGIALAWAATGGGTRALRTRHPKLQVARGLMTAGYGFALMWAFVAIPLLDATAISYVAVIWIVALAPLIGEQWTAQRIGAVLVGFVGALLVIRPTFSDASVTYAIFALLTALNGVNFLLNRYMQDGDQADGSIAMLFHANGLAAIITAPVAFTASWVHVDPWLAVSIIVVGPGAMLLGIVAARFIEASGMAPFNYVRLLLVGLIAPLVFNEPLSPLSLAGGALIVGACCLAAARIATSRPSARNP
jgi:drug/metabolite transporter (DMT)-like permease